MKSIGSVLSLTILLTVGAAQAEDARPQLKIGGTGPMSVTPVRKDIAKQAMDYLQGKSEGDPPVLAFKVPANLRSVVVCEFSALNQINAGMRCADVGQSWGCPKEVTVKLPSGDTVVKAIDCQPPVETADGAECECDFAH